MGAIYKASPFKLKHHTQTTKRTKTTVYASVYTVCVCKCIKLRKDQGSLKNIEGYNARFNRI